MPFAYAFARAALGRNHSSTTLASRTKRCARTLIAHLQEQIGAAHAFRQWPRTRQLPHDRAGSFLADSQVDALSRTQQDNARCYDKACDAFGCVHGSMFGKIKAKV